MYIQPLPPCDILYPLDEWSTKKCYAIRSMPGIKTLLKWSEDITGTLHRSKHSLVHHAGHYSETYIVERSVNASTGQVTNLIDDYRRTRLTVQDMTGIGDVGWTPGQIGRTVNKWLQVVQSPAPSSQQKIILREYNYYHCTPGSMLEGCMWDMSGAYWQMAERIPSPRVYFIQKNQNCPLLFGSINAEQMSRWRSMLSALNPHKHTRLAIIGQQMMGWDSDPTAITTAWHIRKGKIEHNSKWVGNLNPMGLLVVRSVYELCQQQRIEANGCYAYVDCVIANSGRAMSYWDDYGIAYKVKARGDVDIINLETRRVGDLETPAYRTRRKALEAVHKQGDQGPIESTAKRPYAGYVIDPQLYYHPLFL